MVKTFETTPRADGFRMPGEFEPHAGTWMLWPERPDNWRLGAKPAQDAFVAVAKAIATSEPVTMGVSPRQFQNARAMLPDHIRVVEISNNDSWMRDCGPSFVVDDKGAVRAVDWQFNAWGGLDGGLYFPWDQDDLVPQKVAEIEGTDRYAAPIVLEGGSIHVDGEGTLITTEECLLNKNRNPSLSKDEIEQALKEYLSLEKIVWLGAGTYLDETNGHVDNLCCFIRPGVVALTWTDDESDPQYAISKDAYERLSAATDAKGRPFEIHKLYQPTPIQITEEESGGVDSVEGTLPRMPGDRLAASYVNFLIANRAIVMPAFGDPADKLAQETLAKLFPDREVIAVPAREILLGGGNIHCITQQQPLAEPRG
ncbi:agmatine deiminase [Methyloligella sp. 2.7D]|uniref:agmatine deiminase n=1 Tax=unclassified Methyloligella TaxID=2625955 RepID=UPI00157D8714|nr:agmatine deiminase [Methyloligella sp. GL2]QKP77440.1 agmatine deiminase [Methyloligella sp. GL2]